MSNATVFGRNARTYARARPTYPEDLFDWIAMSAPDTHHVWDAGTGSGQAARALAERFDAVLATDADPAQIANAPPHPRIAYISAPSEDSGLPSQSCAAVTVATALHWFDWPRFWDEVARVGRPDGLFCAWTYGFAELDPDMRELLHAPTLALIDSYWAEGNCISIEGYDPKRLKLPFETLLMPDFACDLFWTPRQYADFMESWSASIRAREAGVSERLDAIRDNALDRLGRGARRVRMPLNTLAARLG